MIAPLKAWAVAVPTGWALQRLLAWGAPPSPSLLAALVATGVLLASWRAWHLLLLERPTTSLDYFVEEIMEEREEDEEYGQYDEYDDYDE